MDELFNKLAGQAVTLVGKAAFGLVSKVALDQMNKIISKSPPEQTNELKRLLRTFELKIEVLTPAIELMEISLSRGNHALESVIEMTDQLRAEINLFNKKISQLYISLSSGDKLKREISASVTQLTSLISQIDAVTGYLQLALSLIGGSVKSYLSPGISASRLLQASALISAVDRSMRYGNAKHCIVGKDLYFTLYRLFCASARPRDKSDFTWKEEYAKCKGHVERKNDISSYTYDLVLTEDLDDGRYHEEGEPPQSLCFSVSNIERMYYTSSGKLLNIEDITSPVLVVKINSSDGPLYYALGLKPCAQPEDSDNEEVEEKVAALTISKRQEDTQVAKKEKPKDISVIEEILPFPPSRKSGQPQISTLSLFEYILRLAAVEVSQQKSHLLIPDEMLARFLQQAQVSAPSSQAKSNSPE
ncbi:Ran-specific GTPase-activating protein 30 [Entomophthora muscae]|uniref:Ran-specific GTPase-activating protein 30 n=2 Tax=Entomophthora muscae TaxID=34485 RepID=A0ACC2SKN8_9FUNG|nr:Ran-specific GTPase-activating protein 30 [Entomophthora muscae]